MKKAIAISLIIISLLFVFLPVESNASFSIDDIFEKAREWMERGSQNPIISPETIVDFVIPIGQIMTAIGISVVFAGLVIIGIKYMVSEPEQKGKLKQQLIGLVVAGVVIFGAYSIWKLTYDFFSELFK